MSAEWPRVQISDACDLIVDCVNKTAPRVDHATPYKMIRTPNIRNGRIDLTDCRFVERETFEKWTRRAKVERDDVLLTREAPMGEVGLVDFDDTVFLGQRIMQYRVNRSILLPRFLLYSFLSPDLQNQFRMHDGTGSVVSHIRVPDCSKFELNLPPLAEQERITAILGSLDDKIQHNHQINQTLEQMAQAIFKSWFVDFEPVKAKIAALEAGGSEEDALLAAMQAISGKSEAELTRLQAEHPEQYAELRATAELFPSAMQDSELGEIPEGWRALPLYDTAEYVNGAAFKAKDFSESGSGLPIIKIAELKQGISEGTKYTNSEVKEKYRITDGSVLYSWSGSPETSLEVFKWFGGEGWLNQHIFKLNFTKGQSEHFTYFLLKQMKPLLVRTAQQKQTTGLGHITVADMKRIKIPYPSPELLSAFSENIEPLYSRSSNAVRESKTLADLRDTLLPKLLSGELSATGAEPHSLEAVEIANV